MAKVCPKCHASQPDGVEFCPNDGARLAAPLPAQPDVAPDGDRVHTATLLGVSGDQAQRLAAALQAQESANEDATLAFDLSALRLPGKSRLGEDLAPDQPGRGSPVSVPPPIAKAPPATPVSPLPSGKHTPVPAPPSRVGTAQHKPVPAPVRPPSAVAAPAPAPVPVPPPAAPPASIPAVAPAMTPTPATTLSKLIETSGSLPTGVAVARVCDVAELLMRGRPPPPLTPAHIAYPDAAGAGKPRWTERGQLDPGYVAQYHAPDQDAGASPASDVYVLGCILFEALTGKAPFRGKTVEEIVRKQTMAAAPAVRQVKIDCDLPPALEVELQRALKKRPGDRHPSAAAFAEAIRNAVREDDRSTTALDVSEAAFLHQLLQGGHAAPAQSGSQHATGGPGPTTASGRGAPATPPVKAIVPATSPRIPAPPKPVVAVEAPQPAKRTGLIAGVVVVGIVVIAGGAFLALRGGSQPVPQPKAVEPAAAPPVPAEPDVVVTPDVQAEPDVQPDVQPEPDVQPDVAKPKVVVPPLPPKPVLKPEVKPPEKKPPEKNPDVKPPEKKPDPNGPKVF